MKWIPAIMTMAVFATLQLHAAEVAITPDRSFIRFVTKQLNVPVEGKFRKFAGKVDFDAAKPEATKASFEVELASIDLGSAESESEVVKKEWFNAAAFPKATFVAEAVKATGAGKYEARGKLTVKGVTQPVTAPFTVADAAGVRTVEGNFNMKRLAFNIGEGEWKATDTVADEVQVKFRFTYPSK